jgi:hypothetical protein
MQGTARSSTESERVLLLSQVVIIINYIRFPCEGDDCSVASVKCHTLSGTNYINVRWKKCRAYGARNWSVISK